MAYPLPRPGPCSLFYLQAGHPFMAAGPCDFICSLGLMHHPVQATPDAPLVSIIIPVYNLETRVSSCLDSLLRQTWSPLEIILVNDGSTDRTAHVLNAYAGASPGTSRSSPGTMRV